MELFKKLFKKVYIFLPYVIALGTLLYFSRNLISSWEAITLIINSILILSAAMYTVMAYRSKLPSRRQLCMLFNMLISLHGVNTSTNLHSHISYADLWLYFWAIVFVASTIFFVINIIQCIKWGDESYKEIIGIKEEYRKGLYEIKKEYRRNKNKNSISSKEQLDNKKLKIKETRQRINEEIADLKHKKRMERVKSEPSIEWKKVIIGIIAFVLTIVFCFLLFNFIKWISKDDIFKDYKDSIVEQINGKSTSNSESGKVSNIDTSDCAKVNEDRDNEEVSEYTKVTKYLVKLTCLFIAYLAIFVAIWFMLYVSIEFVVDKATNTKRKHNDSNDSYIEHYTSPMMVFILSISLLSLISGGELNGSDMEAMKTLWKALFVSISLFITLSIGLELIKQTQSQATNKDSLLRLCINYVFILVLKVVLDIIVGFLGSINVKEVISSVFESFLPPKKDSPIKEASDNIEAALVDELKRIAGEAKKKKRKIKSRRIK